MVVRVGKSFWRVFDVRLAKAGAPSVCRHSLRNHSKVATLCRQAAGVGLIYLKLRQAGHMVNYKCVEDVYQNANLEVRRRKGR